MAHVRHTCSRRKNGTVSSPVDKQLDAAWQDTTSSNRCNRSVRHERGQSHVAVAYIGGVVLAVEFVSGCGLVFGFRAERGRVVALGVAGGAHVGLALTLCSRMILPSREVVLLAVVTAGARRGLACCGSGSVIGGSVAPSWLCHMFPLAGVAVGAFS